VKKSQLIGTLFVGTGGCQLPTWVPLPKLVGGGLKGRAKGDLLHLKKTELNHPGRSVLFVFGQTTCERGRSPEGRENFLCVKANDSGKLPVKSGRPDSEGRRAAWGGGGGLYNTPSKREWERKREDSAAVSSIKEIGLGMGYRSEN